jgi:hypothetical protein
MKSYVFLDVINNIHKGNRMAPTNAKFIERIICERIFDYSLGGCYLRKASNGTLPKVVDSYSTTR